MRIAFLTTDNREQHGRYDVEEPYFGTAPAALLEGFSMIPEMVEVHVVSCAKVAMRTPEKLVENIWFHQPVVSKPGWGRSAFLGCARTMRKLLREIQPDVVHGQGTERDCAVSTVLSGYPNLLTIHGNMRVHAARPENRGNLYYKMAAVLEQLCLMKTGGVVAISSYTQSLTEPFAKTWLLPNATDSHFFSLTPSPPPVPRLIAIGSIDERKNPIGLIRAAEPLLRASVCTLAFAGQGNPESPYVREFHRLAESIPGIELLGFIGREALTEQLIHSTALILPTFEDNCPMVVLEAMAAGIPVAASAVGGVPDLIRHGETGLLFDPSKPEDFASAIRSMVLNADERNRLAAQAKADALDRFHPKEVALRHLAIYRELIG